MRYRPHQLTSYSGLPPRGGIHCITDILCSHVDGDLDDARLAFGTGGDLCYLFSLAHSLM